GFIFSSTRLHTRSKRDWSSDVCSSDLTFMGLADTAIARQVSGRGQDQVARAGESHEGLGRAAERRAQAGDLGKAARDQRGARVEIGRAARRGRMGRRMMRAV